ncbi:unnamed protein product [Caenorhabditis auriculariae]|uniref:Glucosylceramidase n=1 Tax=Caenorhabditis auriculariae TaxID=2777116 RepID=A0A8S1HBG2_9PELO|nr:unnamed protein product [Caenorhabditis auriculariae]
MPSPRERSQVTVISKSSKQVMSQTSETDFSSEEDYEDASEYFTENSSETSARTSYSSEVTADDVIRMPRVAVSKKLNAVNPIRTPLFLRVCQKHVAEQTRLSQPVTVVLQADIWHKNQKETASCLLVESLNSATFCSRALAANMAYRASQVLVCRPGVQTVEHCVLPTVLPIKRGFIEQEGELVQFLARPQGPMSAKRMLPTWQAVTFTLALGKHVAVKFRVVGARKRDATVEKADKQLSVKIAASTLYRVAPQKTVEFWKAENSHQLQLSTVEQNDPQLVKSIRFEQFRNQQIENMTMTTDCKAIGDEAPKSGAPKGELVMVWTDKCTTTVRTESTSANLKPPQPNPTQSKFKQPKIAELKSTPIGGQQEQKAAKKDKNVLMIFAPGVVAFFALALTSSAEACQAREYKSGTVCVCNPSFCDEVPALDITMGQGALYTTSKSGKRLQREVVYPSDDTPLATLHMTIDSNKKYQQIQGFGAAFTDAVGANLKSLPDALAQQIIQQYFSPDGLSYTFGRVPMASNDFSTRVYSYSDVDKDFSLQNFNLTKEDFQWKIPFIKLAQQFSNNQLKLIGTPWSAPGWLKSTKQMQGPGILQGSAGDENHKTYADYFVRFLEEYNKQSIQFWGITPQNEPSSGNEKSIKWQTMYFTPEMQRDFVKKDLGPALKASDVAKNVKLIIMDDNRGNLPKWADVVMKDAEAAQYVSGVGFHWYDGDSDKHLEETNKKHGQLFLLGTQASAGWKPKDTKPLLGSWDRAVDYASDILDDLNNWATGWIDYNMVLDGQGGPSWAGNYADAPIIAMASASEYLKQPTWYAMAHISRFIQPGAFCIDHSFDLIELNVKSAAFLNPDGSKVVVVLNTGAINSHTIVLHDAQLSINHYKFVVGTHTLATFIIR